MMNCKGKNVNFHLLHHISYLSPLTSHLLPLTSMINISFEMFADVEGGLGEVLG